MLSLCLKKSSLAVGKKYNQKNAMSLIKEKKSNLESILPYLL